MQLIRHLKSFGGVYKNYKFNLVCSSYGMFTLIHDINLVVSCADFTQIVGLYDPNSNTIKNSKLFTNDEIDVFSLLGFKTSSM